ncbi:uncharacterized protein LOC8043671 [Ixodes scapularis]|nr:uncharacterized protein LOC8043671 [Ixodes scapularis]
MHRRSKSPKKMTERTLTKTDIHKMVQRIRSNKTRESLRKLEGATASKEASTEDLDNGEASSGVSVCIFPCNNPIEQVIAECFKHAKHARTAASPETSQCTASEEVTDVSLSACETLLNQISKKIEELQNEMKLYQTQNENLKTLQQQYHQMLGDLQKEKDAFEAHKQKEMQKLKAEIDEEKRKMRLQKMHKEARQVVVRAKPKAAAPELPKKAPDVEASNQLQRKLTTVTSENTRLKAKLELAEQDRDTLKAMVKQLEEQRLSLLDKIEKSSDVGCYPGVDNLAASPRNGDSLGPHFQVERDLRSAQESAQGDSLCREVKPEKSESSFDLASEICIREGVARTSDGGSDSVLYAATVVARLSLDNASAMRASREANLPATRSRNFSSPVWNGDRYAMERAELAEERAVKESVGGAFGFAARDFVTSRDRLGVAGFGSCSYLGDVCVEGENVRNNLSSEIEKRVRFESSSVFQRGQERLDDATAFGSLQAPPKNASCEVQDSVDFLNTVTKTGIITKEVLRGVPRSGLLGLNASPQRWMSSESFGVRNVLRQGGGKTVPSLMPVHREGERTNGVLANNSVLDEDSSTRICNSGVCPRADGARGNDIRLPVSTVTEAREASDNVRKQNAIVTELVAKSSQEFTSNMPSSVLKQPGGTTVGTSGAELNHEFGVGHGENGPQHPEKPGISTEEGALSRKPEGTRLHRRVSAETKELDSGASLGSKIKIGERVSDEHSEEGTTQDLRDILENLDPNGTIQAHWKVPDQTPLEKLPDGESATRHSNEGKVGSSMKKYSQVNARSLDASKTSRGVTAARKSQSVQIRSSAATREKSKEGNSSRTWALDSKGHRMFLTIVSKEIDPFTQVIIYTFQNGDKKDLYPDGKVVYHYAKSQTVHTVYPSGKKEIQFANGQRELHGKDGNIEVTYPNGTIRRVFSTGEEEQEAPDGTVARRLRDGTEIVHYPNGQKEVRHESYRSRSYPNGTVKTIYPSGKQITKYSNGKVRVKDANGTVLVNTSS